MKNKNLLRIVKLKEIYSRPKYHVYHSVLLINMIISICVLQGVAYTQPVTTHWETVITEHFRVHYPVEYKDWAVHITSRLESIHEKVYGMIQNKPAHPVNIIVKDPFSVANGAALPLLNRPRIVVFTTPPSSRLSIGYFRDWGEELLIHEYAHIAHLTRPPRKRIERVLARLIPVGPLVKRCPAWIIEGYATFLEGKLTGQGRPNGSYRAMFIREMAANGLMPTYKELNGTNRWASRAFRYLYGSAFIEWLEKREGEGSFVNLWKRLSAKKQRSFQEAFKGVFKEPPDELYGKFVVEITAKALDIKSMIHQERLNEGTIWQKIYRYISPITLSPDGDKIALVLYKKDVPPFLEVWSTTENKVDDEEKKKRIKKLLENDPEDVPGKLSSPPEKKVLYKLESRNGLAPYNPRFYPDGKKILFHRYMPDKNSDFHPDIFEWELETNKVRRITRLADVRDAFPFNNGKNAIAIRSRHGKTELVDIDLTTGVIRSITKPSVEIIRTQPVVSPDNKLVAMITHQDEQWILEIYDLKTMTKIKSIGNGVEMFTDPCWSADGKTIYFVSDRTGIPNIERFNINTNQRTMVSSVYSGAFSPVPDGSGKFLYYQSFWSKGINIYRLDVSGAMKEFTIKRDSEYFPVLPPEHPVEAQKLKVRELPPARKYRLGKQELFYSVGMDLTFSGNSYRLGIGVGDILRRTETLVLGAVSSNDGPRGMMLNQRFRLLPLEISASAFWTEEEPSKNVVNDQDLDKLLDYRMYGYYVSMLWKTRGDGYFFNISGSGLASRKELLQLDQGLDRNVGEISSGLKLYQGAGPTTFFQEIKGIYQVGETNSNNWDLKWGLFKLGIISGKKFRLHGLYEIGVLSGDYHESDVFQVGGLSSSILPSLAISNRIIQPVLEQGAMYGDSMERLRVGLGISRFVTLYGETVRAWNMNNEKPDPIRILGLEYDFNSIGRYLKWFEFGPNLDFRFGIARIYDDPLLNKFRTYLTFTFQL